MYELSRRLQFVVAYYLAIYVYGYVGFILVYYYVPAIMGDFIYALMYGLVEVFVFSLLAYIVYRRFGDKSFLHYLGFKREGLLDSLVLSSAPFALYNLLLATIAYLVLGVDPLSKFLTMTRECSVPPWFNQVSPAFLPIATILFWLLSGIVSFAFLQAFSIQVLSKISKKFLIPLVFILFVLYYNFPILTGKLKLDDVIFLGILFPLILYKYGNSIGLILTYTFLYEMPVRAAFLRGWGEPALWTLVSMQLTWGIASMVVTFIKILQARMNKSI